MGALGPAGAQRTLAPPHPMAALMPPHTRRALLGGGGWLFDLDEEQGPRATLDGVELGGFLAALRADATTCEALGAAYVPALVPRKRDVIECAAANSTGDTHAYLSALHARLRELAGVELVDLLGVLADATRHGSPYHRTDRDWNDRGAFFAARALLTQAHERVADLKPPTLADLHVRMLPGYRGALADLALLKPSADGPIPCELEVQAEEGVMIDHSALRALRMPVELQLAEATPAGVRVRVYANPGREDDTRVAVVGGACALALLPWLAERASRTTYFSGTALPAEALVRERPRVVLHLIREADLRGLHA